MTAELDRARFELVAARSALARAEAAIERAIQQGIERASNTGSIPLSPDAPMSEHRRQHRTGRPPKIEADPELRAFLEARIGRLTFAQMAAEVAAQFPPGRRIGKSAIHAWAHRAGLIPKRRTPQNAPG